jgi:hypothetical protein
MFPERVLLHVLDEPARAVTEQVEATENAIQIFWLYMELRRQI